MLLCDLLAAFGVPAPTQTPKGGGFTTCARDGVLLLARDEDGADLTLVIVLVEPAALRSLTPLDTELYLLRSCGQDLAMCPTWLQR